MWILNNTPKIIKTETINNIRKKNCALLLILAIGLCISGCGKQANAPAKPENAVSKAEEPAVCSHVFAEATYHTPKTCTICGETEGTVKPSYFEEHGVQVDSVPVDYEGHVFICGEYDENLNYTAPSTFHVEKITHELQEDNSDVVTMVYTLQFDVRIPDEWGQAADFWYNSGVYDYYTGEYLKEDSLYGDGTYQKAQELTIDGVDYLIEYSRQSSWEYGETVFDSDSFTVPVTGTSTITAHVPEGYDGLVFVFFDRCAPEEDEDDEDEREYFQPDLSRLPSVDGYYLFRMNSAVPEEEEVPETIEGEIVTSENGNTENQNAQEFSGEGFARDFTLEAYASGIDFKGKEEKLKALGWTENPYQTDFYTLDFTNDKGWNEQITPEICVYAAFDKKNRMVYQYQWDLGILSAIQNGTGVFHEYFLSETDAENTCTPEEVEILMELKKEAEALYEKVK